MNSNTADRAADAAGRLEAMVPSGAPDSHPGISLQASADLIEAARRAEPTGARPGDRRRVRSLRRRGGRAVDARADSARPCARGRGPGRGRRGLRAGARAPRRQRPALRGGAHPPRVRRAPAADEAPHRARTQLRAAVEVFERLGAAPWEERARSELRATGETARRRDPSTLDDLTPQELQIVRRVAEGATNKAVAAQLFISPRTVAYHLRNVFVKLGISSPAELIRLPGLDEAGG